MMKQLPKHSRFPPEPCNDGQTSLDVWKKYDKTIRILYWFLPVNVFFILQVQVNSGYTPEAYACSPYKGSARGTHQVRELQIHLRMEIWRRESSGLKTILLRNGILLQLFIRELISISGNDFDMFIDLVL